MSKKTVITKKKSINDKDNEKEEKEKKNHTKWNDQIYDLHPYFVELVVESEENAYRFVCLICQKNSAKVYTGWRESLRDHLQTEAHIEFTPKEDRKESERFYCGSWRECFSF